MLIVAMGLFDQILDRRNLANTSLFGGAPSRVSSSKNEGPEKEAEEGFQDFIGDAGESTSKSMKSRKNSRNRHPLIVINAPCQDATDAGHNERKRTRQAAGFEHGNGMSKA